jgi:Rrf2 family protein
MKVSNSIRYGLLALGYVSQHKGEGTILSQTIAGRYKIPLEYLLKIMLGLVKAKILKSKRGPHGGFSLARPLKTISMLEVIEAIEGPMKTTLGLNKIAPKEKFAAKISRSFDKMIAQERDALKKIKLSQIV